MKQWFYVHSLAGLPLSADGHRICDDPDSTAGLQMALRHSRSLVRAGAVAAADKEKSRPLSGSSFQKHDRVVWSVIYHGPFVLFSSHKREKSRGGAARLR